MPYRSVEALDPHVRVLLLEDSSIDADLIAEYLKKASVPIEIVRAASREQYLAAIEAGGFKLILSDFSLPAFDGMRALEIAREKVPDTPFIFVSGVLGEEIAIDCLKKGATDYVLKPRLSRLPAAVERALKESEEREQRRRVELRTRLLVAELSHRVKNTLMTVVSLARQTIRRSDSLEEFEKAFMGRLQALAGAHALLLRSNWGDMDLVELVDEALKAFRRGDGQSIAVDGSSVMLPPRVALTLNLIIHELATNAAKYGALSTDGGRVDIGWTVEDGAILRFRWQERNGPPVQQERRNGFGTTLIRRSAGFEMGGEATIDFDVAGVRAELALPLQGDSRDEVRPDAEPGQAD